MDALRSRGCGEGAGAGPSDGTLGVYARILGVCASAGLTAADAQDVAQEIFVWLVQSGKSEAAEMAWLGAVARNFVQRYRRRQAIRTARESRAAVETAAQRCRHGVEEVEANLVFDKLGKNLPFVEAKLLYLVRYGCTFPEAVRSLGVPRGSWSYFKRRLVGHLKEGLGAGAMGGRRAGTSRAPTASG